MSRTITLALAATFALSLAPVAHAGGALARLLAPTKPGGGYVVETLNCGQAERMEVTAVAEGLVNGVRRTVALQLERGERPGQFVMARQWPAEGRWVVRLVLATPHAATSVTPILSDGRPGEARLVWKGDGRREAAAALALR